MKLPNLTSTNSFLEKLVKVYLLPVIAAALAIASYIASIDCAGAAIDPPSWQCFVAQSFPFVTGGLRPMLIVLTLIFTVYLAISQPTLEKLRKENDRLKQDIASVGERIHVTFDGLLVGLSSKLGF